MGLKIRVVTCVLLQLGIVVARGTTVEEFKVKEQQIEDGKRAWRRSWIFGL